MPEQKQILDHGYVSLVETWGSDERIIEAARMSTDKGFLGWGPLPAPIPGHPDFTKSGDEKLLAYLYNHKHMTPFEMCGMVVEVKAPIFVFREWHRHRTQSYNELSARYTPLPNENYIPTVERLMMSGGVNKQAQGVGILRKENAEAFLERVKEAYENAQGAYEWAVSVGVPKELARLPVPVARYSKMRASANLGNWLQFLTLRMDKNAQWEIQQYAEAVGELIQSRFPRTWELFTHA